jgi:hypothetical protein
MVLTITVGVAVVLLVLAILTILHYRTKYRSIQQYEQIVDAKAAAEILLARANDRARATLADAGKASSRAKDEADRLIAEGRRKADELRAAARDSAATTTAEAEQLSTRAKDEASKLVVAARQSSEQIVAAARSEATRVVGHARYEAKQIAGDAFEAKGKADEYQKLARAMKNIIEGYGDEYLVPNRSVLDELAEDFSHKNAGEQLKEARTRTRTMLKEGFAATCDYKDRTRKETAIHFVIDAFNGKTDSILTNVKHDNLGKLAQEIQDAFSLVNKNGEAFKNARIQPAYLDSRLQELKWGVAVTELKRQEQVEQRRIKEQIREEERARREYEKAIKAAEKEERVLQKALKEAQLQLKAANEEQRKEYEARLAQLEAELSEAHAKGERALSMAQLTRSGHVYIISNVGSFGEDVFKIGLTRRLDPMDRVKELGDASVPFEFDVHAMIHAENAPALENELHQQFKDCEVNRVNARKEFFRTTLLELRRAVEQRRIETHWTMKAEAREYRETLAIEQSLATGSPTQGVQSPVAVHN